METVIDVLVVGAGTAGIPTALFAADRGLQAVLIDASDRIGGTLHVSSGHMSAGGTRLQAERGIQDSAEAHHDDVMRICRGTADAQLVRLATANAARTIDWLMDRGFDMAPECPVIAYSHEPYLTPRTYWGRNKAISILDVLDRELQPRVSSGKVDLRLRTRLTELRRDKDGKAWQAVVDDPSGGQVLLARNVVLATGGYGANPDLFQRLTEGLPLLSPAPACADGSGIEIALRLGGKVRNTGVYLPTLGGIPATPGGHWTNWDEKANLTPQHRQPWEILVNLHGQRFVAEDNPSPASRERALKRQPELAFWVVFDERIRREAPPLYPTWTPERWEAAFAHHPAFVRAASLEELARRCGFQESAIRKTIDDYNRGQAQGRDELGRRFMPAVIAEPPFYALRHQGVTLRCWAGLEVDGSLRVVGSGGPMEGLYAVGEILGGAAMSGDSFASGMSLTPALTFGRLLGERILQ